MSGNGNVFKWYLSFNPCTYIQQVFSRQQTTLKVSKKYCMKGLVRTAFYTSFNPFPHTTILQKTNVCQKMENLYNWMDNLKSGKHCGKGVIARFEQFLLLSLCIQKAVCCRGIIKRLYEGKGYSKLILT